MRGPIGLDRGIVFCYSPLRARRDAFKVAHLVDGARLRPLATRWDCTMLVLEAQVISHYPEGGPRTSDYRLQDLGCILDSSPGFFVFASIVLGASTRPLSTFTAFFLHITLLPSHSFIGKHLKLGQVELEPLRGGGRCLPILPEKI